ncbi:hypothetical protein T440DRAFT_296215 [Plenodomus tracheiphilus IPT5]|uniref:Uncharacterized protein n=1 Tax=Plenodomus tracheiphilus IPT5 TaxID=1408161 RepID=A0A6A7BF67_9PLEO|nr:hypothetical protein T440DRAFT_296215 [Plenodomus tracheiphilus IPT5]
MPATLRLPSTLSPKPTTPTPSLPPPTLTWLSGPWNVTHSTLPMWKKSRNVRITYTPLINTTPAHINDLVTYQSLSSETLKSIHGVDKPFNIYHPGPATAVETADATGADGAEQGEKASLGYNWRGKGWLMIASSKWEILGYGDEEGGNSWVVTYFAKTLFTPAGVDFYSRQGSLRPETLESLKAGLAELGGEVAKLAGEVFEVKMDGARKD